LTYINYSDPLHIVWRAGTEEDPYIDKEDTFDIVNSKIILTEIPSELNHVTISGMTEIYTGTPIATEFIVDYATGVITFHSDNEGLSKTCTYKGRGLIMYPASRIYYTDGTEINNIQQIIDNGQLLIQTLTEDPDDPAIGEIWLRTDL